jgi:hypothetical protein
LVDHNISSEEQNNLTRHFQTLTFVLEGNLKSILPQEFRRLMDNPDFVDEVAVRLSNKFKASCKKGDDPPIPNLG